MEKDKEKVELNVTDENLNEEDQRANTKLQLLSNKEVNLKSKKKKKFLLKIFS